MRTIKSNVKWIGIAVALSFCLNSFAQGIKPTKAKRNLPAIWNKVPTKDRLGMLRVAQMDALTQLAERIYGFHLNSGTTVYDFALENDDINSKVETLLVGASETDKPEFTEDGIVYTTYGVGLRKLVEIVKSELNKDTPQDLEITESLKLSPDTLLIEVTGNGAIPGSKGMNMIKAKRVAEVDAYRQMAQRFLGIKLTRDTTVKDFCLKNDKMQGSIAAYLKGIKTTGVTHFDDGSCEVKKDLKIREVIKTVEVLIKRYKGKIEVTEESIRKVNTDFNDKTFSVTGRGTTKDAKMKTAPAKKKKTVKKEGPMKREIKIIRELIEQRPVVD